MIINHENHVFLWVNLALILQLKKTFMKEEYIVAIITMI